jgi:hypothetical protein
MIVLIVKLKSHCLDLGAIVENHMVNEVLRDDIQEECGEGVEIYDYKVEEVDDLPALEDPTICPVCKGTIYPWDSGCQNCLEEVDNE